MKMTRRITILLLVCLCPLLARAQWFSGEYTSEWQWDMQKETNWVNLLRLNLSVPVWKGKGSLEAATLHVARTGESIIEDWQGFSNVFADNQVASIAVLGYMHEWQNAHLFAGVRNVNEDFFVTDITSLFTNSSCGIFPAIASSYPIANYPLSGLTLYFDVEKDGWTFKNSLYNGTGYNGWKRQNNPFLIKPKRDGVFNMSQLEYEHAWATIWPDSPSTRASLPSTRKATCCRRRKRAGKPPVLGDYMENNRYGSPAKGASPAWHSIPRTPASGMRATGMRSWVPPTGTV